MFPYSSRFWKDWKVLRCCGISSWQTYSIIIVHAQLCLYILQTSAALLLMKLNQSMPYKHKD